ncbi:hypothetical protein [Hoeflea poritis]|uniref:Uncharacterized protein n=1 Tax=Hoeflea poritis TaxID=2993659 RepID=A0ABT4VGZ4_9HYPH|nr:hypothetical protein [Hoeflea poritis]MDA4843962.1 hypothetical protein [Hoeflea poritis]
MNSKYIKLRSLSWWTGFAAVACGTVIAAGSEVAMLTPAANILSRMTEVPPAAMITFGLGLIGLRGKDG